MLINKANLDGIFTNLKAEFNRAFEETPTDWNKVAMEVPSTGSENDYKWMSKFPMLIEWIGEKTVKALEGYKYVLENIDFEATIEVRRNDIEDDNLGIYKVQAENAGFAAATWVDEIVFGAINNGFTELCYDGQYFFDTDHPVGRGAAATTDANLIAVDLTAANQAGAENSLGAAGTAARRMVSDEGRSLNVRPSLLLGPPEKEADIDILLNNDKLKDDTPNRFKGKYTGLISSLLTDTAATFLLDATRPIKPFIYQNRKKPVLVSQTTEESDIVFMRGSYLYGVEARGNAGYSFWQLAVAMKA